MTATDSRELRREYFAEIDDDYQVVGEGHFLGTLRALHPNTSLRAAFNLGTIRAKDYRSNDSTGHYVDRAHRLVFSSRDRSAPPWDRSTEDVAQLFQLHRDEWVRQTAHFGSIRQRILHPSYQRIIGLGPAALPLIINELERELDHWFWALMAIVGEDMATGASTVEEAAQRWVSWARENGIE